MSNLLPNSTRCDHLCCTYKSLCLEFDFGGAGVSLSISPRMDTRYEKSTIMTNR
jgi:hypothetical protein